MKDKQIRNINDISFSEFCKIISDKLEQLED